MKRILTLLTASVLTFTSCTSENDNQPTSTVSILPKTISSIDTEESITTITYDGNKILKISKDNNIIIYSYTGDLITKKVRTEKIDGSNTHTTTTVYTYTDNKLVSDVTTDSSTLNSGENKTKCTYTYNSNGTILRSLYHYEDNQETFSGATDLLTVSGGNVIKNTITYDDKIVNTEIYEYDTKNSIFKNILGMDKLNISRDGESVVNNTVKFTSSLYPNDNYIKKYIYNEQGYPTEIKEYYGDELDGTYKVAY